MENGTSPSSVASPGAVPSSTYTHLRRLNSLDTTWNPASLFALQQRMPPNGALGGVETPMAYAGGMVGVPMVNSAMNWTPTSLDFSSFNLMAGTGDLVAIDVNTGEKLWDNRLDAVNVGSAMVGGNFSVVDNLGQASVPGEGHVHFYLDAGALPSDPTKPAIPTGPNASWAHVSGTTCTFTNVTVGQHTFAVQLVNNDHAPITPIVSDSATVTASGIPVTTTAATTAATTTMPTTATATTATTTAGGTTSVDLTAYNFKFDKSTITVPVGAQIPVTFNNMDSGIPHNFAVYTDASASTTISKGAIMTGPATTTYTFTAPSTPGTYFFRCDVHPTVMAGQFIVQ